MITNFYVKNAEGQPAGNGLELDTLTYPLQLLTWAYVMAGDDISRPFTSGRYNTRKSVNHMTIDCEGEIIATTTTAYWQARKSLVAAVIPAQEQPFGTYHHSILNMKLDDSASIYVANVVLSSYSIPLAAKGSPTVSPFQFSWTCNEGYWYTGGQAVLL
jgi:hypothetical protein